MSVEHRGWRPDEIVLMKDDENTPRYHWPTKQNLVCTSIGIHFYARLMPELR